MDKCCVNLGCGIHAPENWINLDSSFRVWLDRLPLLSFLFGYQRKFTPWVRRFDVRKVLPFKDTSVDFVYSSHMIEHLTFRDTEKLVRECFRVLKPGGRIRLMTPNLHHMVQNYLGRRADSSLRGNASGHFFECLGVVEKKTKAVGFIVRILQLWQQKNAHRWLYDDYSLKELLDRCGFRNVVANQNWITDFPDLDLLEPANLRAGSVCAEGFR